MIRAALQRRGVRTLLSAPAAAAAFADPPLKQGRLAVFSDPPGRQLGSGGGTIWMLLQAWRSAGSDAGSFSDWLSSARTLVIHGGGRSRRLPAYAAIGKPLLPIPVMRRSFGQALDQRLIDFQLDAYESLLGASPDCFRVMVSSGDVLLTGADCPRDLPAIDVLGFGIATDPEIAQDFGVFVRSADPFGIDRFLQKPESTEIVARSGSAGFLIDTGAWLLSAAAIDTLLAKCALTPSELSNPACVPEPYDLYGRFGPALGERPGEPDAQIAALTAGVCELPRAHFYHFGTSRQLIDSVASLQNSLVDGAGPIAAGLAHPPVFVVDSAVEPETRRGLGAHVWIDNSVIGPGWRLASRHIVTGVPENGWDLQLDAGECLDIVPTSDGDCVRGYGFDDPFSGPIGEAETLWHGMPASEWFARRGLSLQSAGIAPECDIHEAPIFPLLGAAADAEGDFVQWLVARRPAIRADLAQRWIDSRRLSALDLNGVADPASLTRRRRALQARALPAMQARETQSVFYRLDLEATAALMVDALNLPALGPDGDVRLFGKEADPAPTDSVSLATDSMLRALLARRLMGGAAGEERAKRYESDAFATLRAGLVRSADLSVDPTRRLLDDQIVWAHAPVRLDLGGGWTDTPPYCLQHGGRVVNIAVDLNGQPPIQVFARLCAEPHIAIRSIDLGVAQTIASYEELDTFDRPGSEFALAKAAFALSGFLPQFQANARHESLRDQLRDVFGGGIELSMVSAVPAGSGLGTSSILAATLLATLSELSGLEWNREEIVARTMALEQMLTTGGGWQDQVGGAYLGAKIAETGPGAVQRPTVRWLPDHLFTPQYANVTLLLYYTGVTRLAKNILQDIVRGMFLNQAQVLRCLRTIGQNALLAETAIQHGDYGELARVVGRSWDSNRALDSGTDPPEIARLVDMIQPDMLSAKLLGAGGGGYLLIFAKDAPSAMRIRTRLAKDPPNSRARFVDFALSNSGLRVTRS